MSEQWGVTFELSGVRQRGAPRMSQFLGAISYLASKTVVLDAGMAWGLTKPSSTQIAFVGVTVLVK